MAYIKIKRYFSISWMRFLTPVKSMAIHLFAFFLVSGNRFQEAENDCTEALNLDDRYIKAYSRRSTARKELGKLKESIDGRIFIVELKDCFECDSQSMLNENYVV